MSSTGVSLHHVAVMQPRGVVPDRNARATSGDGTGSAGAGLLVSRPTPATAADADHHGDDGGRRDQRNRPAPVRTGLATHRVEVHLGRGHPLGDPTGRVGESLVQAHDVASLAGGVVGTAGSPSTSASRRAAAWPWLFTVPGAIPRVSAIWASVRSS